MNNEFEGNTTNTDTKKSVQWGEVFGWWVILPGFVLVCTSIFWVPYAFMLAANAGWIKVTPAVYSYSSQKYVQGAKNITPIPSAEEKKKQ